MKHKDLRQKGGEKAILPHWHIIQMAGHQHELHHNHLVLLEDPSHVHHASSKSSDARFLPALLEGARLAPWGG